MSVGQADPEALHCRAKYFSIQPLPSMMKAVHSLMSSMGNIGDINRLHLLLNYPGYLLAVVH